MKIEKELFLINRGSYSGTTDFNEVKTHLRTAISKVSWDHSVIFIINPTRKANGVTPIKKNFIKHLTDNGWLAEQSISLISGLNPGPIDAILDTAKGTVAAEWETGNISSSHRALNKLALSIIQKKIIAGFLILPMRELAQYLTDRIGNFEEISPYFPLYENLAISEGVLYVFGVSQDSISSSAPFIPKGKDGHAAKV